MTKMLNVGVYSSLTRRDKKGKTRPAVLGRGNMPCRVREGETSPQG